MTFRASRIALAASASLTAVLSAAVALFYRSEDMFTILVIVLSLGLFLSVSFARRVEMHMDHALRTAFAEGRNLDVFIEQYTKRMKHLKKKERLSSALLVADAMIALGRDPSSFIFSFSEEARDAESASEILLISLKSSIFLGNRESADSAIEKLEKTISGIKDDNARESFVAKLRPCSEFLKGNKDAIWAYYDAATGIRKTEAAHLLLLLGEKGECEETAAKLPFRPQQPHHGPSTSV